MAAPEQQTTARRHAPDSVILAIACVAQFMVVLDVSIVNVALPSIGRDLHYSATGLQWVVNAYVLTFAGFLLLGGRAADLYGRRKVFLIGVFIFSLASLLGGLAQNSTELTVARALQGFGGAVLSPATLTIIVTTFTGAKLAKALGAWSAVAGAGGAVGVLLGGILTAELSWRWVLYVNVPIGIGVFVAAVLYLTEAVRPELRQKLDVAGAITVTAGLFCLVYAIVGTDVHAWTSPQTLGFLGAAVVLLGAFALIETKLASHPLVPFRLFKSRALTGANTVIFLVGAVFFSLWYFLSLYLQTVLHYGALKTGMAFLPMAIGIIIGAQLAGRRLATSGPRPLLLVGMVIVTGGFFWLSKIGVDSDYWTHILPPGMMISFGVGLVFAPLASAATAGVAPTEAGLASALLVTFRQVGGSLGLAVLATIATDQTKSSLSSGLDAALASGYAKAFAVAAGLAAAAIACSFIVPARRRTAEAPARQVEAPPAEGSVNPALEG